jgi:DNA-binding NarL/FixJ family response regulator
VDVTIADIHLDATMTPRQVSSLAELCKVVLFSAFSREPFAARLAEAGAIAVVDKSARVAELEAIVRDVHAGRPARAQRAAASTSSLSEREQLVFHALAKCATPKEVATELGIARSTVYCHIDRIRQKLGVETLQEIVALAYSSTSAPPSEDS